MKIGLKEAVISDFPIFLDEEIRICYLFFKKLVMIGGRGFRPGRNRKKMVEAHGRYNVNKS